MAKAIKVIDVSSADAINEEEEVEQAKQVEPRKSEEAVSEVKPEVEPEREKNHKNGRSL